MRNAVMKLSRNVHAALDGDSTKLIEELHREISEVHRHPRSRELRHLGDLARLVADGIDRLYGVCPRCEVLKKK
jgi:hypothetical protein